MAMDLSAAVKTVRENVFEMMVPLVAVSILCCRRRARWQGDRADSSNGCVEEFQVTAEVMLAVEPSL